MPEKVGQTSEALIQSMLRSSENVGKIHGRLEAFYEAAQDVQASIPGVLEEILNPDDRIKVANVLLQLASKILRKV